MFKICLFSIIFYCSFAWSQSATEPTPNSPSKPTTTFKCMDGLSVRVVADGNWANHPTQLTFLPDGNLLYLDELMPSRSQLISNENNRWSLRTIKWDSQKTKLNTSREWKRYAFPIAFTVVADQFYWIENQTLLRQAWVPDQGPQGKVETLASQLPELSKSQHPTLTWGQDGWLYMAYPRFDHSALKLQNQSSVPLSHGQVFRCRLDGSQFHLFSQGLGDSVSPVTFATDGQAFVIDQDWIVSSKLRKSRLIALIEDGHYSAERTSHDLLTDNAPTNEDVQPGFLPASYEWKSNIDPQLLYYDDDRMSERIRDTWIIADPTQHRIRAYRMHRSGCKYKLDGEIDLLQANDSYFHPANLLLGPDGAIYFCDLRSMVATNSNNAEQASPSIKLYRLEWKGTALEGPLPLRAIDRFIELNNATTQQCLEVLASPNPLARLWATTKLSQHVQSNKQYLTRILLEKQTHPQVRLSILIAFSQQWHDDLTNVLATTLDDDNPTLVRTAAHILAWKCNPRQNEVVQMLAKHLMHADAAVQRAIFLASGRVGHPDLIDSLVNIYKFDLGQDPSLTFTLIRAIERLDPMGVDRLVELAGTGVALDRSKAIDATATCRSSHAADVMLQLLDHPHLTELEQLTLIRAVPYYQGVRKHYWQKLITWSINHPSNPAVCKTAIMESLSLTDVFDTPQMQTWLLQLFRTDADAQVRITTIQLLSRYQNIKIGKILLECFSQEHRPMNEKRAMLRLLGQTKEPQAELLCVSLLKNEELEPLHEAALGSLLQIQPTTALRMANDWLPRLDPSQQGRLISIYCSNPEGAKTILGMYKRGQLHSSNRALVADGIRQHTLNNPPFKNLYFAFLKDELSSHDNPKRANLLQEWISDRERSRRGRTLFFEHGSLQCCRCHRKENKGGEVGPELDSLPNQRRFDDILLCVIEPNRLISPKYKAYRITNTNGLTITGVIKLQDDQRIVFRDANDDVFEWKRNEIKAMKAMEESLMNAEGLLDVSFNELLDLLSYLAQKN